MVDIPKVPEFICRWTASRMDLITEDALQGIREEILKAFRDEAVDALEVCQVPYLSLIQKGYHKEQVARLFRSLEAVKAGADVCQMPELIELLDKAATVFQPLQREQGFRQELLGAFGQMIKKLTQAIGHMSARTGVVPPPLLVEIMDIIESARQPSRRPKSRDVVTRSEQPKAKKPKKAKPFPKVPLLFPASGPRLLVIDDDRDLAEVVLRIAQKRGFDVECSHNPRHSLEQLMQQEGEAPVDVIITDIKMPEISGLDVLKALREKWPAIPVVLMSGQYYLDEISHSLLDFDGCFFLSKPFSSGSLSLALKQALRLRCLGKFMSQMTRDNFQAYLLCRQILYDREQLPEDEKTEMLARIENHLSDIVNLNAELEWVFQPQQQKEVSKDKHKNEDKDKEKMEVPAA